MHILEIKLTEAKVDYLIAGVRGRIIDSAARFETTETVLEKLLSRTIGFAPVNLPLIKVELLCAKFDIPLETDSSQIYYIQAIRRLQA